MNTLVDVLIELARELYWTKVLLLAIIVCLVIIIGPLASINEKLPLRLERSNGER